MAYKRTGYRGKRLGRKQVVAISKRVFRSTLEKKFFDVTLVNSVVPTGWVFGSAISGIVQGTGASNRTGNKIKVEKIEYMIAIHPLAVMAMAQAGSRCRVVTYKSSHPNGAFPTALEVFVTDAIMSLRNSAELQNYYLEKDYVHCMSVLSADSAGTAVSAGPPIQFKWTVYPRATVSYQLTTGTIVDVLNNDLGIACIADDANCCNITVQAKVTFTDA